MQDEAPRAPSDSSPRAPSVEGTSTQSEGAPWHPLKRHAFRFATVYFVLYALSYPISVVPLGTKLTSWPGPIWERIVDLVGTHVFGLTPELVQRNINGSGDTTFDYVQLFSILVMSILGALLWWGLDRRRPHYRLPAVALMIAVRFFVGAVIIFYGFGKTFNLQFGVPSLTRLITTYGDSSPMGLAWTFMGASPGYSMFAGLGEVIGGLLLFFRRTTTLGALILFAVMTNVVMLNLCYDIPVKIFSSHLLLLVCALLIPDLKRMAAFAMNRPTQGVEIPPLFTQPRLQTAAKVVNVVVVAVLLQFNISVARIFLAEDAVVPPLYGIHDVEAFAVNGEERPPLLTDDRRWRSIVFARPGRVAIQNMDGTLTRLRLQLDLEQGSMVLSGFEGQDPDVEARWTLERPSPKVLELVGELDGDSIRIRTREREPGGFLLSERGFRWISERPFNR
ncbi:MAG: DoxX family protein [Acidobacteriota bacterium]